jgi:chromosome segregation ATPase
MLSNAQALDDQVLKAREDVDDCLQAKRVTEKKISKLKQDLAKHKPVYDNKLSVAEETCPRDELDQSKQGVEAHWEGAIDLKENTDVADIERLLKKLRANIKSFEKESGSLEELELKFYKADKEYEQAQKMYMKIADPFALINSGVDDRWRTFRSMRKSIAKQTNFMFQGYMGKRGYSGKLHLNHDQETLKITVNVGDGKSGSAKTGKVRDMKSLSGGERSLSTLCFVLSLGTNCESPFRASDEFDVFMDAVNRKVSLRTLLHFAVESPETQMILLTPQDLAAVDEVKVELKENENYHEKFIKLIVMPSV